MPLLQVHGITKRFGSLTANDRVTIDVEAGEVHAVLGENGAGKSTLMNIIYGLLHPDEGSMTLAGQPFQPRGPREAMAAGIGMVHQHFMLIPALTVVENIVLGREPGTRLRLDLDVAAREIRQLGGRYHMEVDPYARVRDLPVGLQQRVEILKAFYRKARLLILDEPTAMLTPQETGELFAIIERLQGEGLSILFISHKLEEARRIAQRITVMRLGRVVETLPAEGATAQELANAMVGRDVVLQVERDPQPPGDPVLEVENLTVLDATGKPRVKDLSLTVRAGEIVGIAGVDGNGQEELAAALAGLLPAVHGRIRLAGRDVTGAPVRRRLEEGLGYIPADRQAEGLVMNFTLAENLALRSYWRAPYARGLMLAFERFNSVGRGQLERFDVRPADPRMLARQLSGGNQQKVILAREVGARPKMLIASQPTRGLDVGAIEFVQRRLLELRSQGTGILLISLELEEILALSDRIGVLYGGQLVAMLDGARVTRERVGLLMAGSREEVSA